LGRGIVTGLRRAATSLDIFRVQEIGLEAASDPEVLEWAAREGRILVTHDYKTMPTFAYGRVGDGLPMPGVLMVPWNADIGAAIDELALIAEATDPDEWANRVVYLL
jgi:hypothetical protein